MNTEIFDSQILANTKGDYVPLKENEIVTLLTQKKVIENTELQTRIQQIIANKIDHSSDYKTQLSMFPKNSQSIPVIDNKFDLTGFIGGSLSSTIYDKEAGEFPINHEKLFFREIYPFLVLNGLNNIFLKDELIEIGDHKCEHFIKVFSREKIGFSFKIVNDHDFYWDLAIVKAINLILIQTKIQERIISSDDHLFIANPVVFGQFMNIHKDLLNGTMYFWAAEYGDDYMNTAMGFENL